MPRSLVPRGAMLIGSIVAAFLAHALASPAALGGVEAELVLLLRGMPLIKASIALAAVALVLWRFGRPVSRGAAMGYVVGIWALVAATVLIWFLSFIAAAAVLFHLATLGLLVLAWREGRVGGAGRGPR